MEPVLLILALLSLAAWLFLFAGRGGYWHAEWRLPPGDPGLLNWPSVLVVVPARNEAEMLPQTLPTLLAQDYAGPWRVVVVDDHSTDGTDRVLAEQAAVEPDRLAPVPGRPLPSGWTGKLWALQTGLDAAGGDGKPLADYIWFTDADIAHDASTLSRLVGKAVNERFQLVSLMAKLESRGLWAGLLIPAFVYFFQKLYPFRWVSDGKRPAAAGGCVLLDSAALDRIGGLARIRGELIDDCALAAAVGADADGRVWLGLSETTVSRRPYRGLGDVWDMVARTAFTELNHSVVKLAGTVVGMVLLYVIPPVVALAWPWHGTHGAGLVGVWAWVVMAVTYLPTLKLYGRSWGMGFSLPLAGLLYTAMTIDSARRHWLGRGGNWKGRAQSRLAGDAQ